MTHFKSDYSLQAHTRVWSGKYKCDQCNATFCTLSGLQMHQKRGCDIKSNVPCNYMFCNFCNAELKWKTSLQSHLFHVHGDLIHSGKNADGDAPVRSNDLANFSDTSLAEELAPPSKRRKICQSIGNSSPLVFKVSNSPSTDTLKNKLEKCKECIVLIKRCDSIVKSIKLGENISLQVDLKETMHLPSNANSASFDLPLAKCVNAYKCSRCEKAFPLKKEMKKHMIAVHLTSTNYTARYKSKMLLQHYMRHSSILFKDNVEEFNICKKLHHCAGCRKRFWLRSCLDQHEKVCRIAQRSHASALESSKDETAKVFDENQDSSELSEGTFKRNRSAKILCIENMKKLLDTKDTFVIKRRWRSARCSVCGQFRSFNKKCMYKILFKHYKIRCNICHQAFASRKMLKSHTCTIHKYNTSVCGKSFHGMYQLHHHNKLEHYPAKLRDLYTYMCSICEEGFNYESHLHAHKFHVHPDGIIVDMNIKHDHTYTLPTNIITMSENIPSIPIKTYTCDVCDLQFTNKEDLKEHQLEYSNIGEIYCKKCTKSYNTIAALAKHYSLNHSGSVPNIMKCCHCNEALTTNTSLQCHMRHFHGSNASQNVAKKRKRNSCMKFNGGLVEFNKHVGDTYATCNTKFDHTVSLKNHLLEYSNIGSYDCIVCHWKFAELRFLEKHKMNHVDSRDSPVHCPICNEGFTDSALARIHVLHLHSYESSGLIQNSRVTSNRKTDQHRLASRI
ncbi:zinc finger protein 600-like, partial [Ceratina calcarata]|uniref:Zinc finger protein 600-like n=1 Tax=Ceratina calcarata TaxID=156304 RepID=A0AAJ7NES9_9HYME